MRKSVNLCRNAQETEAMAETMKCLIRKDAFAHTIQWTFTTTDYCISCQAAQPQNPKQIPFISMINSLL